MTTYLLDSDVFIQAKRKLYGFDFCPGFWDWIDEANHAGTVFSIEAVKAELMAGKDELADWAAARGNDVFLVPDAEDAPYLRSVSTWAQAADYRPAAVDDFLGKADYFLIAQALSSGYTVVTMEQPGVSATRVKIPDACDALGVPRAALHNVLRTEGVRFVLGPRS